MICVSNNLCVLLSDDIDEIERLLAEQDTSVHTTLKQSGDSALHIAARLEP